MTKKHFIALADAIRNHERRGELKFSAAQLEMLAAFCREQNSRFDRQRWLDYIAGECGPSGGTVRSQVADVH